VDQSQSFNVWMDGEDLGVVTDNLMAFHRYGWRRGLKTGSYYVRTRVQFGGQKFALSGTQANAATNANTPVATSTGVSDKTSSDSELSDSGSEDEDRMEAAGQFLKQMVIPLPTAGYTGLQRRGVCVPTASLVLDTEEKQLGALSKLANITNTIATTWNKLKQGERDPHSHTERDTH